MAVTELTLWIVRLLVLVLMYGFLLALIFALRADARAATAPRAATPALQPPAPKPSQATAPASSPAILTLSVTGSNALAGQEYQLSGQAVVGRGSDCDIVIPGSFVSKRHLRLAQQGAGWMAEDLGSTNGTLLNGAPLTSPQPLKSGDRLTIGDVELAVK